MCILSSWEFRKAIFSSGNLELSEKLSMQWRSLRNDITGTSVEILPRFKKRITTFATFSRSVKKWIIIFPGFIAPGFEPIAMAKARTFVTLNGSFQAPKRCFHFTRIYYSWNALKWLIMLFSAHKKFVLLYPIWVSF